MSSRARPDPAPADPVETAVAPKTADPSAAPPRPCRASATAGPPAASPLVLIALESGPLAPTAPPAAAIAGAAGAETSFVGRTRAERHPHHGPLLGLAYEAHAPLARRGLERIACEVANARGVHAVRIRHALGPVAIGETSLEVTTWTPHRREGFAACAEIVDRLKREIPIWKTEHWSDGATTRPPGHPAFVAAAVPASVPAFEESP